MKSPQLAWKKRSKKRETDVSTIWRWESACGGYAVERHVYKVSGYAEAWFALYAHPELKGDNRWRIISNRHRKRSGAALACQLHSRAQHKS